MIAPDFPGIRLDLTNIDAQMNVADEEPEDYQIVVASNLFGDIASDAFAGLVGGLASRAPRTSARRSRCSSRRTARRRSSRTRSADHQPIAIDLSGAMLLDHVGETAKHSACATRWRPSWRGKVRTYDMLRLSGSANPIAKARPAPRSSRTPSCRTSDASAVGVSVFGRRAGGRKRPPPRVSWSSTMTTTGAVGRGEAGRKVRTFDPISSSPSIGARPAESNSRSRRRSRCTTASDPAAGR